jgi:hypothetical protein
MESNQLDGNVMLEFAYEVHNLNCVPPVGTVLSVVGRGSYGGRFRLADEGCVITGYIPHELTHFMCIHNIDGLTCTYTGTSWIKADREEQDDDEESADEDREQIIIKCIYRLHLGPYDAEEARQELHSFPGLHIV